MELLGFSHRKIKKISALAQRRKFSPRPVFKLR
jgi:hypothetical protein